MIELSKSLSPKEMGQCPGTLLIFKRFKSKKWHYIHNQ